MAQPQIQYSPIAESPAFTPPTTDAQGWKPAYPTGRAGIRRASLHPAEFPNIVNVFVPEKWAIPQGGGTETPDDPRLGQPHVARRHASQMLAFTGDTLRSLTVAPTLGWAAETPDDPKLGRRAVRAPEYPALAYDSVPERWTIPQGAGTESPDNPQQFIARRLHAGSTWFAGDTLRALAAPTPVGWGCELPDDPRLGRRAARLPEFPALAYASACEQWSIPQGNGCELPDDPRLGRRAGYPTATLVQFQYHFGVEILVPVESWTGWYPDTLNRTTNVAIRVDNTPDVFVVAAPTVTGNSWQPDYPDRVWSASRLKEYPALIWPTVTVAVAPAPSLSWEPSVPDRVWSAARLRDYPSFTEIAGLEQFAIATLSWQGIAPSRLVRAKTLPEYPAVSTTFASATAFSLQPAVSYPDRLDRARRIAAPPAHAATSAIEQWTTPLGWRPAYQDYLIRARRLSLYPSASDALTTTVYAFPGEALDYFTVTATDRWFVIPAEDRWFKGDK